jgi:hypothetical protein
MEAVSPVSEYAVADVVVIRLLDDGVKPLVVLR